MQKMPVLILADGECAKPYKALSLKAERMEIRSFKEGLNSLKRRPVDIVVLDCGFHVCSGLRTVRRIKGLCPDTPVVFLTDLSSENAVINAFRAGVREYFRKPVNIFELQMTLQRLLAVKRTTTERRLQFVARSGRDAGICIRTATTDKPAALLSVINFVEENLRAPLALDGLARKANLSKYHFCRIFKQHTGANPMKFVAALRIEKAKELLRRTDLNVSLIANEVGFNDLCTFIRQFKKVAGVTPSFYKDSCRNGGPPSADLPVFFASAGA